MYAVITSPSYWKTIEKAIQYTGESLLFQNVDKNIDLSDDLEKISRISVNTIILDVSSVDDKSKIPQAIMNYKIKKDKTRFIIIAPGYSPGDNIMSYLFSIGVWDFIVPNDMEEDPDINSNVLYNQLIEYLNMKPSYQKGVRWFNGSQNYNEVSKNNPVLKSSSSNESYSAEPATKIIKLTEIKTKEISITFEKKLFCIWGCSEFGCEFAYKIAELSKKTVAVIDLDFLKPTSWVFLKSPPGPEANDEFISTIKPSIGLLIEKIKNNKLSYESLKSCGTKRNDLENLYLFTTELAFIKNKDDYDYLLKEFKNIINLFYKTFDVTILLCNKAVNDPFTLMSLENSSNVIVPFEANVSEAEILRDYKEYLKENSLINWSDVFYIAFKYNQDIHLTEDIDLRSEHGMNFGNNYIGHISYSIKREKMLRTKRLYARRMEANIENEYVNVLKKFDIPLTARKHVKSNKGILRSIHKLINKKKGDNKNE